MLISVILLSGGIGSRMGNSRPKQYLSLCDKPIILRSLEALLAFPESKEIVIVCEPEYRTLFSPYKDIPITFALPGPRRQDSVFSGYDALTNPTEYVCIHDGARPFVCKNDLIAVIKEGIAHGAATLATPIKTTVKEADANLFITKTLDRSKLFHIQTPQVLHRDLIKKGRSYLSKHPMEITDDVTLAELLGHPVKLVLGSESNIKITTPYDLAAAKFMIEGGYV